MNLKKLLADAFMSEWSDEEIAKLNENRLQSSSTEWNTSSSSLTGAGDGATNLRTILAGTSYKPGCVALAEGIGLVIIEPGGDQMRTETGRILTIGSTELKSTERQFYPLYSPGLKVENASWKLFLKSLSCSSVDERREFYGGRGDEFTRNDMPYMFHSCYGRPMVVTTSARSNNYYSPNDDWALFHTNDGLFKIGIKAASKGSYREGNNPPYTDYNAFRELNDDELELFSMNPRVISFFERMAR